MYIPHYFKNEDIEEVREFIRQNSFGILLTSVNNKIQGTHIPLELETDLNGKEIIYGHISKANFQWKDFEKNKNVLLIFNGPHAYVSSSWYNHENVSTWNYIAVHIYGKIKFIEEEELKYALNKLVDKYEGKMENPVRFQDLSKKTMGQMKGILGFKILISKIQAAYKLSQNRNEKDYKEVVSQLEKSRNHLDKDISNIMKKKDKNCLQ